MVECHSPSFVLACERLDKGSHLLLDTGEWKAFLPALSVAPIRLLLKAVLPLLVPHFTLNIFCRQIESVMSALSISAASTPRYTAKSTDLLRDCVFGLYSVGKDSSKVRGILTEQMPLQCDQGGYRFERFSRIDRRDPGTLLEHLHQLALAREKLEAQSKNWSELDRQASDTAILISEAITMVREGRSTEKE